MDLSSDFLPRSFTEARRVVRGRGCVGGENSNIVMMIGIVESELDSEVIWYFSINEFHM
jgi:hypothetical protein